MTDAGKMISVGIPTEQAKVLLDVMLSVLSGGSGFDSAVERVVNGMEITPPQRQGLISVVDHGSDAGAERPASAATVYWIGSVEPVNAVDNDIWHDTGA